MDIGKAFGFMFKDPSWGEKMIIFVTFCFLCFGLIGIPFVLGYMIRIVQTVAKGEEKLPAWKENFEEIATLGFEFIGAVILFSILGGIIIAVDINLLTSLWNLFTIIMTPLLLIKVAVSKSFGEVFDFGWYINFVQKNLVNLIIIIVMEMVFTTIGGIGLLAFLIGIFFSGFYAMTGYAYLLGEMYRLSEGAAPKPEVPVPSAPTAESEIAVPTPEV